MITILDAIAGIKMFSFSGHTDEVNCLTFSSDGVALVSGSDDKSVKFWDIQTGGVIRNFYGHTKPVCSVSISTDLIRIASGSEDNTINLWDTQTEEILCTIKQHGPVHHVGFSPIDPQHIISICCNKVLQWNINGHQIPPTYNATQIAFSPDHTQLALCDGKVVTVRNSDSGAIVTEFYITSGSTKCCCFSPDGRLVAVAAGNTAYVLDLTSPGSHLIAIFDGHTAAITSLVFTSPSSLVSASRDSSIKFWKIGTLSTDTVSSAMDVRIST